LGLKTATVALLANEARFFIYLGYFSGTVLSKTKSVTLHFFFLPFWQK